MFAHGYPADAAEIKARPPKRAGLPGRGLCVPASYLLEDLALSVVSVAESATALPPVSLWPAVTVS